MKDVAAADTRNFALVGHSTDGKTSLGEAILWKAGAIPALGNVTAGTAALTTLPEERERQGASVSTAVYGFDWQGRHLTLVDTPGDPNFQRDGQIALQALDAAVLVVSAVDGAKVGTERMWRSGRNLGLPMLAFVNGMDRERADFEAAVASLAKMDAKPVLLSIPIGSGANFTGVVDVLAMQALGDGGPADVPADLAAAASEAHAHLVEAVAECDDALLEKYLETGELSADEMRDGLLAAVRQAKLVPIFAGSATRALGVEILLQAVTTLLPSPVDARSWTATELGSGSERTLAVAPDGPFAALVFKSVIDRFQGLLSVLRVVSGTLQHDTPIVDATTGTRQRIGKLHLLRGHDHVEVPGGRARRRGGGREVEGRPHRSRAHRREGRRAARADPDPEGRTVLRDRREVEGRRGQALHLARAARGGRPDAACRSRPEHRPVPADRHGRPAHPHRRGPPEAHVQPRDRPVAAEDSLPRDDHSQGRERGGQAQEADRRQGHVRGLLPERGTAAPWGRVRVRRRDRRRLDPAQPDPGRREGRPRRTAPRTAGRASRSWTSGCAASTASTTRSTRTRWPSSWLAPSASRPPRSRPGPPFWSP